MLIARGKRRRRRRETRQRGVNIIGVVKVDLVLWL